VEAACQGASDNTGRRWRGRGWCRRGGEVESAGCVSASVSVSVRVVVVQQYVGSKKPPTDGRSDETEFRVPANVMAFVSRGLVV
jgi:hypothetical protein